MKSTTGFYLNVFTEIGHTCHGIRERLDIAVLFPEYIGCSGEDFEILKSKLGEIEDAIRKEIERYAKTTYKEDISVKERLKKKATTDKLKSWEERLMNIGTCDIIRERLEIIIQEKMDDYDGQVFVKVTGR